MSQLFVGVDGGGSKTEVVVIDGKGKERAARTGDASAIRPGEALHTAEVIAALVRDALLEAQGELGEDGADRPVALVVGVAGAGQDAERTALQRILERAELADDVYVTTDAEVALTDAFGEGPGILLISGTGSIAFGRGPTGTLLRCGGWGPICGDEGSGAWIGRRALSVVTAAHDGREPETKLVGALLTALELESVEGLIPWAAAATPRALAAFAPTVLTVAAEGDLRANAICTLAAEELVLHARTLARQLFVDERAAIPVALAGGMLGRGGYLRRLVEHRLKHAVPGCHLKGDPVRPARGAAAMARSRAKAAR